MGHSSRRPLGTHHLTLSSLAKDVGRFPRKLDPFVLDVDGFLQSQQKEASHPYLGIPLWLELRPL